MKLFRAWIIVETVSLDSGSKGEMVFCHKEFSEYAYWADSLLAPVH